MRLLSLTLLTGTLLVRWRNTPEQASAKVARIPFVIAMRAQWSMLAMRPCLLWQSVRRIAVIAEAACSQTAIHTWPAKHCMVTGSKEFELGHSAKLVTSAQLVA